MENIIAYHCAPALAGIKPSNIVTCYKHQISDIHEQIDRLNSELNSRDIYFEVLFECDRRVLIMVYRTKVLESTLNNKDILDFLKPYGYPQNGTLQMYIDFLKQRFTQEEVPHEIGTFLGYPLKDICAFINHKDEGCLLCGEWKVYHNVQEAKILFKRFSDCRKAVLKRLYSGQSLAQVFCVS